MKLYVNKNNIVKLFGAHTNRWIFEPEDI